MSKFHETIIDIKATPEEVFRAITESDQIVKWFAPYAKVEPGLGGKYSIAWGPELGDPSTISAWDPYTHFGAFKKRSFAYGSKGQKVETGTVRDIAVDYYIEPLGDGMTRLRLVQSGFGPEAAWDGEIESVKSGWAEFLKKLKEVLES